MKSSQILQNLGTFEERLAGSEGLSSVEPVMADGSRNQIDDPHEWNSDQQVVMFFYVCYDRHTLAPSFLDL